MKSRASLLLMEQLTMVLIFALATALCLQVFVRADAISIQNTRRDRAVMIAQNAAEMLKAGAQADEIPGEADYPMEIRMVDSGVPGLCQAEITVGHAEETAPLFALNVGWQEVAQ